MNGPDAPDTNPTGATSAVGETILHRFRVEKVLGRGGMGEVLLAHDTVLNRRVALKRLRSDGAESTSRRGAILKEARRASQISDRRIAAIYDVIDLDSDVLIVMEFVDGSTLRARMTGPLPLAEFWDLSSQCAEAVAAAHARGLIHRDIKPENLMVTGDGQIKILDFGIARRPDAPDGGAPTATTVATTITAEGHSPNIAGTPQYMAPEAHYGGRLDERTDIFSLGTVFYELLAGRNPFAGAGYQTVLERVMTVNPQAVSGLNPEVGPALSAVIARMMAKDPAHRQGSCGEVLRDLAAARGPGATAPVTAQPVDTPSSVRALLSSMPRWRVAGAGLVLLALVVAWALWSGGLGGSLPADRNLAVLAPVTAGASDDFANFALGAFELLSARLQRHQEQPGFQIATFREAFDEKIRSAADARKVQGVTLALIPTLEQRTDTFHARLELWNAARDRLIASRIIDTPVSQPFRFLDGLYQESVDMLELVARPGDASAAYGVRGAGTLRFLLQGVGRMRRATTEAEARRALDDLELARRAEPDAAATLGWLAIAQRRCYELGHDRAWVEKAEASAREAIASDSTRAEGYRALGLMAIIKPDVPAAIAAFSRACALNPADDDSHSRLGSAYGRIGRHEEELATYRSVIQRRPHCWQPYWWLANTHYRRGQIDESIQAYRELVWRAPGLARGYSNLGGLLVLHGDYAAAIDTLKASLALRPTKIVFDNLGTAYFNSGRINEAVEAYNQAFQFGFAEYDSWLNLGDAYYFLQNRGDRAGEAYTQAVRLGRELILTRSQRGRAFDVMIPANLATVFPKIGQPDSARFYMGRALAADSTNPMVQYCAALTHWQLADKEGAVRWLERAVQGGYPVAWLRDSPVFREWREQEGFRALLARAGADAQHATSPR